MLFQKSGNIRRRPGQCLLPVAIETDEWYLMSVSRRNRIHHATWMER